MKAGPSVVWLEVNATNALLTGTSYMNYQQRTYSMTRRNKGVEWICLVQHRAQWLEVVNTATHFLSSVEEDCTIKLGESFSRNISKLPLLISC